MQSKIVYFRICACAARITKMSYAAAGPGEVLRSVQKDEVYSGQLSQLIAGLGLDILGPAAWLRWGDSWAEPAVRKAACKHQRVTRLSN